MHGYMCVSLIYTFMILSMCAATLTSIQHSPNLTTCKCDYIASQRGRDGGKKGTIKNRRGRERKVRVSAVVQDSVVQVMGVSVDCS